MDILILDILFSRMSYSLLIIFKKTFIIYLSYVTNNVLKFMLCPKVHTLSFAQSGVVGQPFFNANWIKKYQSSDKFSLSHTQMAMASTVAGVSSTIAPYSYLSSANSKPSDLNPKFCSLPLNCSNQSFSAFRSRICITKNAPLRPRFSPIVYSSSPGY